MLYCIILLLLVSVTLLKSILCIALLLHAGIKRNVVVFTTLMNVCQRAGQHERAIRLFRSMEAGGLSIDVVRHYVMSVAAALPTSH